MKLCDDGLVYDIASQHCDYPAKVNCTGRPDLRESIDFGFRIKKSAVKSNLFLVTFSLQRKHRCLKTVPGRMVSSPSQQKSRVKSSGIAGEANPTSKNVLWGLYSTQKVAQKFEKMAKSRIFQ